VVSEEVELVVRTMLNRSIKSCSFVLQEVAGAGVGVGASINTNALQVLPLEDAPSSVAPIVALSKATDDVFECLQY